MLKTFATSSIAFFATLFVGLSAHAIVQPAGVFIPYQCGEQTIAATNPDVSAISSVCIGSVVGTQGQAVQYRMTDHTFRTFVVSARQDLFNALISGNRMAVYQLTDTKGETTAMKAIVTRDGVIKSVSGDFEQNSFLVPDLHVMMIPM